jgi:hypothetical protein
MAATGAPRKLLQVIYDIGRLEESLLAPNHDLRNLLREIIPPYASLTDAEAAQRKIAA